MLIPADIDNKQFGTTRLKEGYDQDEVDDFLDAVTSAWRADQQRLGELFEENARLKRQLRNATEAPTAALPPVPEVPSVLAERLLAAAQSAHDEHVADGKSEADRIVREAGSQGARIVEEANEAAERIKSEGLAEKYRRNDELDQKIDKATQVLGDLDRRGNQVRRALADMINSYDSEFPK